MSGVTRIRIVLALVGVAIFAVGIRLDHPRIRFVGIGVVAVAWLFRFVRPHPREDRAAPEA